MKKILLAVAFLFSQTVYSAPAAKTNDVDMEDIQKELMQEIDSVKIDESDEQFLEKDMEAMPEVEDKLQIISQKPTEAPTKTAKKVSKAPTVPVKKK